MSNPNKKLNKFPTVVTNPSNANPKTGLKCKVVKNPSPANRSLNAPARVSPTKH
jgi:hypothetical protein